MRNLTEFNSYVRVSEKLEHIDNVILSESLQSNVLKDVAKQLLDQINANKNERGYWRSNKNFREIFGLIPCEWDKITDDDFEKIEVPEDPTKNDKIVRSVIRGSKSALILGYDEEKKVFKFLMYNNSGVIYLHAGGYAFVAGDTARSGRRDITEREKVEMFRGLTLYVIKDFNKFREQKAQIQRDRRDSKTGVVNLDPVSMKEYARDNIRRYKEIIADRKFKELDNDALIDDVNLVLQKIVEIVSTAAKDPVTYADSLSDIGLLNQMAYDTMKYDYKAGRSYGEDGLLPLLSSYIDKYRWYGPGSSGYGNIPRKDSGLQQINAVKDRLEKRLNKVKQYIGKIEVKMGL